MLLMYSLGHHIKNTKYVHIFDKKRFIFFHVIILFLKSLNIGQVTPMTIQSTSLTLTNGTKILISKDDIEKLDSGLIVIHTNDYLLCIAPTKSDSYISIVDPISKPTTYTDFDDQSVKLENLSLNKESIDLITSLYP